MSSSSIAYVASETAQSSQPNVQAIDRTIGWWRALKNDRNPGFADAARFAIDNPDFPGVWSERGFDSIRLRAEKAISANDSPDLIVEFFRLRTPQTGAGWAQLAYAYQRLGRQVEALEAARGAWRTADLSAMDEAFIEARFASQLTRADHDARIDALLFDKKPDAALRLLQSGSPDRRAIDSARIAMQRRDADANDRYNSVRNFVTVDAGLMMDRARYHRDNNNEGELQSLLATQHQFTNRPADVGRWYEMLLIGARGAEGRGDYATAFNIARQLDDAFPPGEDLTLQPYEVRDHYTSLAWLAGNAALTRLNRPADAASMFERYAGGGRSLQVYSKGMYWAGRAAQVAGDGARANGYFAKASETPELFYSQLALERLGREIPVPQPMPLAEVNPSTRAAFQASMMPAVTARLANSRDEQTQFVRAMAEAASSRDERILITQFANSIRRPDLAVWVARSARNNGIAFYYREAFPVHDAPPAGGELWSLAHAITRQESSFDAAVRSHANAYGMMQLLPGTAQDQARRSGIPYSFARLTQDPAYNVRLGTDYFALRLRQWDGNVPLALASYNAGYGRARDWAARYGDPRSASTDTLMWIENIPFSETRSYVQRVIENAAVYDRLNPYVPAYGAVHVSRHIGKAGRPG
ncbi:lytic transglycosylase domain-containing protein [Sphingomicrobium flavum]|uniref:lytic transglycosylase domain-containing protein n=1 Tax=Sphingomicrobium flavum TaxID=1229164 RepID=UPI0021AD8491|nr:lytic transglycosylase domain-containing protein [Sphingomicrobium flavum]